MNHAEKYQLVRDVIAINVGSIRKQCGYSQAKFAETISVDRSYINQIERGKENVTVDILVKIADGLDVPLTSLLSGLQAEPPYKLDSQVLDQALNSSEGR